MDQELLTNPSLNYHQQNQTTLKPSIFVPESKQESKSLINSDIFKHQVDLPMTRTKSNTSSSFFKGKTIESQRNGYNSLYPENENIQNELKSDINSNKDQSESDLKTINSNISNKEVNSISIISLDHDDNDIFRNSRDINLRPMKKPIIINGNGFSQQQGSKDDKYDIKMLSESCCAIERRQSNIYNGDISTAMDQNCDHESAMTNWQEIPNESFMNENITRKNKNSGRYLIKRQLLPTSSNQAQRKIQSDLVGEDQLINSKKMNFATMIPNNSNSKISSNLNESDFSNFNASNACLIDFYQYPPLLQQHFVMESFLKEDQKINYDFDELIGSSKSNNLMNENKSYQDFFDSPQQISLSIDPKFFKTSKDSTNGQIDEINGMKSKSESVSETNYETSDCRNIISPYNHSTTRNSKLNETVNHFEAEEAFSKLAHLSQINSPIKMSDINRSEHSKVPDEQYYVASCHNDLPRINDVGHQNDYQYQHISLAMTRDRTPQSSRNSSTKAFTNITQNIIDDSNIQKSTYPCNIYGLKDNVNNRQPNPSYQQHNICSSTIEVDNIFSRQQHHNHHSANESISSNNSTMTQFTNGLNHYQNSNGVSPYNQAQILNKCGSPFQNHQYKYSDSNITQNGSNSCLIPSNNDDSIMMMIKHPNSLDSSMMPSRLSKTIKKSNSKRTFVGLSHSNSSPNLLKAPMMINNANNGNDDIDIDSMNNSPFATNLQNTTISSNSNTLSNNNDNNFLNKLNVRDASTLGPGFIRFREGERLSINVKILLQQLFRQRMMNGRPYLEQFEVDKISKQFGVARTAIWKFFSNRRASLKNKKTQNNTKCP